MDLVMFQAFISQHHSLSLRLRYFPLWDRLSRRISCWHADHNSAHMRTIPLQMEVSSPDIKLPAEGS